MKFVMSYSICQRKYLLWSVFDDGEPDLSRFKICEFRVCDCFFDWLIRFQNKNKNTLFSEEVTTHFFDTIPTDMIGCDIFSIFGKITIVYCKMHCTIFSIRKILIMINLMMNVWGMILKCAVCIYLREISSTFHVSVQIVNLIL